MCSLANGCTATAAKITSAKSPGGHAVTPAVDKQGITCKKAPDEPTNPATLELPVSRREQCQRSAGSGRSRQQKRVSEALLDTTYDIATPEGVELQLPVAGFGPRCFAWMLDAAIKFTGIIILAIAAEFMGEFGTGLLLISMFTLLWLYNVLFEVFNHGATPGKTVLGLRVMNVDGTPVGWSGSIIRNLIRVVDALPGVYLAGLLSTMLTQKMQRLGDLAANTVVIFGARTPASGRLSAVDPEPLNIPLTPDEQKAIVSFGERAPVLNSDRADELASIVAPVMNNASTDKLRAHAAWIVGLDRPQ